MSVAGEIEKFGKWVAEHVLPSLPSLYKMTRGDPDATIAVLKAAYDEAERRQEEALRHKGV